MARSRQLEQPAVPKSVSSRSGTTRSKPALAALIASALVAFWALTMLTGVGRIAYVYVFVYLDFYIGVVSLVSMSLTVMAGVLSTDRLVLMIRHRILLQSVHRVTGIIAVGALGMHILVKLSSGYVGILEAFIPFISGRGTQGVYIGLGTLAAYGMVSVLWTGLVRARFVDVGRPWVWRALHSIAYASWPFALVHGLNAGRQAATWVIVSYILCVVAVVIALLVRLAVSVGRKRKDVPPSNSASAAKSAAKSGEETETRVGFGSATRRSLKDIRADRERSERYVRTGPPDPLTDSWINDPASRVGPPRRRSGRYAVPEVPLSATKVAPSVPEEPWDSPQRWSRRSRAEAVETTSGRRHRAEEEERTTRYARAEEERTPRYAEEERTSRYDRDDDRSVSYTFGYSRSDERDDVDRSFAPTRRWSEEEQDLLAGPRRSRAGRHSEEELVEPRRSRAARHSRDDDYDDEVAPPRRRTPRYAPDDDERPRYVARDETPIDADDDDTPTLVDLASRRARRAAAAAEGGMVGSRSSRRRRAAVADAVDEAYWRSLRGEAR